MDAYDNAWRRLELSDDVFGDNDRLVVDKVDAELLLRAACRRLQLPEPDREFILRCMLDAACEEVERGKADVGLP
jgi:hypothetical protein